MPDRPGPDRLTLTCLDACDGNVVAEFTDEHGRFLRSIVSIRERDGIRVPSFDPDPFARHPGSVDELRKIVGAVIAFADARPT